MPSARKKPPPASVFSQKTSSPGSISAASSTRTSTPPTPSGTPLGITVPAGAPLQQVSSRNSLNGLMDNSNNSINRSGNVTRSPNTFGNLLSATATPWHPTPASRTLWQTNAQTFAGPVFPATPVHSPAASPVQRGAPGQVPSSGEKEVNLAGTDSNPSSSTGPTPTLPPMVPSAHDLSSVSPAAFPADYSGGRFRDKSSRASLDGAAADDERDDDDEVVLEFVPLSDRMARSEAEIIAHMVGAQRRGLDSMVPAAGGHTNLLENGSMGSRSSGADTADMDEMVDEMDRHHESIGTPATMHPRQPGGNRSGSGYPAVTAAEGVPYPQMNPEDFLLGPAHSAVAHFGAAAASSNAAGGGEGAIVQDEDDFNDYDTQFDDELYDSELDWIEEQLEQHSTSHHDPGLFLF